MTARDRRRSPRVAYAGGYLPPAARIHPGIAVIVVNLSPGGVLVEGAARLRPGMLVDVRLTFPSGPLAVDGEVVRSAVHALDRYTGVRYRSAIAFTVHVPVPPLGDALDGYQLPGRMVPTADATGSNYPRAADGPLEG